VTVGSYNNTGVTKPVSPIVIPKIAKIAILQIISSFC